MIRVTKKRSFSFQTYKNSNVDEIKNSSTSIKSLISPFIVWLNYLKVYRKKVIPIGRVKTNNTASSSGKLRPALSPENREKQLISLAVDLAEQQLMDRSASSQVISHYLKLGSTRQQLENEKLIAENELLKAKAESIQSQKKVEELYAEALKAMRNYAGQDGSDDY